MSLADWAPVVQPLIEVSALVITGFAIPRALDLLETRTGIHLTDQQTAAVLQAAKTAAGILRTSLDQGKVRVEQITVMNPVVQDQARAAIMRVPESAAGINKSIDSMAATIVGLVDTSPTAVVPVAVIPPGAPLA